MKLSFNNQNNGGLTMSRTAQIRVAGHVDELFRTQPLLQAQDELHFVKLARERINAPAKWHKGDWTSGVVGEVEAMCLGNAICGISLGRSQESKARLDGLGKVLSSELPPQFQEGSVNIFDAFAKFNDAPETTYADVMAFFDRVEAKLAPLVAARQVATHMEA